jgi:hypothetical protein
MTNPERELVGDQLSRKRGDTVPDVIVVTDPVTGNPIDIAGFTFVLTINEEKRPTDTSSQLVLVSGVIVNPSTDGRVAFAFSPAQSDQSPGNYWYDIEMDTGTYIKTIAKNRYRFYQDISKTN